MALVFPALVISAPQAATGAEQAEPSVRPQAQLSETLIKGKGKGTPLDDADIQDLTHSAKTNGRDVDGLISAHEGIHDVQSLTTKLETTDPDVLVRWGLSRDGEAGDYWFLISGEPTEELTAALTALPTDTRLISGAVTTSAELSGVYGALVTSLMSHPDSIRSARTTADGEDLSIIVEYTPTEAGADPANSQRLREYQSEALAAAARASRDGLLPVDVSFVEVQGELKPAGAVQGGRALWSGGFAVCTSGFTAQRGTNRGVVTAGHCADSLIYNNNTGMINNPPIAATPAANGIIDLQWHRTLTGNGHTTNSQFAATSVGGGGDRTVLAVANAGVWQNVCKWGSATGYSCSFVSSVDQCVGVNWGGGQTWCGQDLLNSDILNVGDSGGPFFNGNTALGISSTEGTGISTLTRIGRVNNNLGASVLVN